MAKNKPRFNETVLFDILHQGDIKLLKAFIIEFGVNSSDRDNRTILMNCILEGSESDCLKILKFKDLDVNAQDGQGFTALHFAVQENKPKIVSALLKKGIRVDQKDKYGNTALWRAVMNTEIDPNIIKLLINSGANPGLKNKYRVSPLDLAGEDKEVIQMLASKL